MAVHRPPQQASSHRRLFFYIPPLLILIMVAALLFFIDTSDTGPTRDEDLCPAADGIAGRAEFLLDLRKPTGGLGGALAVDALRTLTLGLDANTELRVFAVTDNSGAPRQLLDRLCKPYGNADLAFEGAKDRRQQVRDCDDLPAQLPNHVRSNAEQFCARRAQLGERIEELASAPAAAVPSAYLVEALEETGLELAELSGRRSLYVFSDMLQHSSWYSHLELGWNGWSFADFIEMRTAQDALVGPRPPAIAGLDVTIFYLPREGVTELPRLKSVHKRFWQDYFAPASPDFREQALLPAYQAAPLMNRLTEAEQERLRLRQEREEAERLLAQVEQERAALEEARRQAEVEERAQQAQVEELRRQRELLQAEEARRAAAQVEAASLAEAESQPETESQAPAEGQEAAEGEAELASQAEAEQDALAVQEAADQEPPPPPPAVDEPPTEVAQAPAAEPPPAAAIPEQAALEPCRAQLQPEFRAAVPPYPGRNRIDYGAATVVVQFSLNEQGEVVDDTVAVLRERTVAEQPDYLNLFTNEVVNLVSRWEFAFEQPDSGACARSQQFTTQFQFSYGN